MQTLMQDDKKSVQTSGFLSDKEKAWFNALIQNIVFDRDMMDKGVAPKEKYDMYKSAAAGDADAVIKMSREQTTKYIVTQVLNKYTQELINKNALPLKLAFDYSASSVLVWAEIKADDWELEKKLILAEANVNAEFDEIGFHITSTIIEDYDQLAVPPHYFQAKITHSETLK
jgi:hypothetical protein